MRKKYETTGSIIFPANVEGEIYKRNQEASGQNDGTILNAGAYTRVQLQQAMPLRLLGSSRLLGSYLKCLCWGRICENTRH